MVAMIRLWRLVLAGALALISPPGIRADDWPQWLGVKRDSVWRETGILEKFPEQGPPVLWRQPVAGGYAGPAVAEGKVFVADFLTDVDTRLASVPDKRPVIEGQERIHCFDAKSGELLWTHSDPCTYSISYPAGPRCTPTVHQGKVYALGAEGNLFCLDAAKGDVVWSKVFKRDFSSKTPLWGFCGHPLVEGKNLICVVSGKDGLVYAFDKDTGRESWHALSAGEPGYSPPTVIEAGGARQLLIWHPKSLNSLNPETGNLYWTFPFETNFTMSIMTPRQSGDMLFVGGIMGKSTLLKLAADRPAVTEVWRGSPKTGASPVNSTPFLENGIMYAVDQPGQLLGVRLDTGERVWQSYRPVTGEEESRPVDSGTAFLVKNGNRFFLTCETGHLVIARLSSRGYDEVSRWKMLEPTGAATRRPEPVLWSHPAFANKCIYARNDKELICVNLASE
jgi:outer membrane protein assembly factor BamB